MPPTYQEPSYPTVRFLIRHGLYVSLLCAALPLVWFWPAPGWTMAAGGIVAEILAGVFVQSYIEVLRIMSDTLLPR